MPDLEFQLVDICVRNKPETYSYLQDLSKISQDSFYIKEPIPCLVGDDDDDGDGDDESHKEENTKKKLDENCWVCLFGRDKLGNNVLVRTKYCPFAYIEIPSKWTMKECQSFVDDMSKRLALTSKLTFEMEQRKRTYGWIPDLATHGKETQKFSCIKVRFPSVDVMKLCFYILRKHRKLKQDNPEIKDHYGKV